jgi:hypothetical protein
MDKFSRESKVCCVEIFRIIIYIIRCTIVVDFDHILRQAFFLVALATIRNMDILMVMYNDVDLAGYTK